ncbi:MAG TPA: hypothetical protein VGN20_12345 [Mucilaginibacter sp.]|jgi:hypothetical protein
MSKRSPKVAKTESPEVVKKSEVGSPESEDTGKSEVGSPKSENQTAADQNKSETAKPSLTPIKNNQPLKIEHPASEIKPKSEIVNPKSEIKMEVHHHPEVEKKGFKEYILEGLMIFLAVFMGFVAESIRENITNNEHAQQLALQLVQDLKTDTTNLRQIDSAESKILARTDTLSLLLKQPIAKLDTKNTQRLVVHCYSLWPFHPALGAITAIKNELHLKQFANSKISNYLSGYEGRTDILRKLQDLHNQLLRSYIEPFLRLHFTAPNLNAAMDHNAVMDGQMRNLTQNDLTQLDVDLALIRNINDAQINYNRKLKAQAIELIQYVTKQYHLENE